MFTIGARKNGPGVNLDLNVGCELHKTDFMTVDVQGGYSKNFGGYDVQNQAYGTVRFNFHL